MVLMKPVTLLSVPVLLLLLLVPAHTHAQGGTTLSADEIHQRFIGAWDLVIYETFTQAGESVDMNHIGRITYDSSGNMSAVGMHRDFPQRPPGAQGAAGFAYFGTIEIVPEEGFIVHNVVGTPMIQSWPGTDLIRYYEFTPDGLLKLSIRDGSGRTTGTLTWRRLDRR